jgi:hypothetical protein
MKSTAPSVAKYLLSLPPDRRPAIEAVRRVILANVDKDIEEEMAYGAIGYVVPHRIFPGGYHCDPKQPVPYIGLASQKNHMSLYLMFCYSDGIEDQWIRRQYAAKGKRLDLGKSCLRFKRLEDIDLEIVGQAIRRVPTQQHIATYVATVGADKWRTPPAPPPRLVPLRPEPVPVRAPALAAPKARPKAPPKARPKPKAPPRKRARPKAKSRPRR